MKKCLNSKKNVAVRHLALYGFLFMGLLLIIFAYLSLNKYRTGIMCWVLFFVGVTIAVFGIFVFAEQSRQYSVDFTGITIYYWGPWKHHFSWADVGSIVVCDVNHAAKNDSVFDIVIRIAIGTEINGPFDKNKKYLLDGHDSWRSFEYGFFNYKRIILLDYSSERMHEIQKASGRKIYNCLTKQASCYMAKQDILFFPDVD